MSTCLKCGADLLLEVCPSCPVGADDPTIPIPASVLDRFRDSTRPPPALDPDEPFAEELASHPPVEIVDDSPTLAPPPLESNALDEEEPPTTPDSPIAKKISSHPPRSST